MRWLWLWLWLCGFGFLSFFLRLCAAMQIHIETHNKREANPYQTIFLSFRGFAAASQCLVCNPAMRASPRLALPQHAHSENSLQKRCAGFGFLSFFLCVCICFCVRLFALHLCACLRNKREANPYQTNLSLFLSFRVFASASASEASDASASASAVASASDALVSLLCSSLCAGLCSAPDSA